MSSESIQASIGPIELENGYPAADSVRRLYDELDFQRAVRAWVTGIRMNCAIRVLR